MIQRNCLAACVLVGLFCAVAHAVSLEPGDIQPNFTLNKFGTTQQVNLYNDLAGKILVFDFFAHWCGPCMAASSELEPYVQQYYAELGGNASRIPVQLVSVNIQGDAATQTQTYIDTYGLEYVLDDPSWMLYSQYSTGGIPRFAIVNGATGTNKQQWEVVWTKTGYGYGAYEAFRTAIDSVVAVSQSRTWVGTADGFLSTSANWQGGAAPDALDPLVFGPTGLGRPNPVNGGATPLASVGGITFDAPGYSLSGTTTLTVNGAITNNAAAATIDLPIALTGLGIINGGATAGNMLTLAKPVSGGNAGLTKAGAGTLVLGGGPTDNAPNTYAGTTTVNEGVLILNKQDGVNAVAGPLTVAGGTVRFNQSHQVPDVVVTVNSGTLDLNGRDDSFSNLNLYGGQVTNGGSLGLSSTSTALTVRSASLAANVLLTSDSGGTIAYENTNGGTAALAGSLNLGSVTRTFSIANGPNAVDMNVSANITATGTAGLTKTGSGTLALSGNNSYTGPTTVSQGVLRLSTASALPGGVGPTGGTSNLSISRYAIVELDCDFSRPLGTGADAVQLVGYGGVAAASGRRTVNFGGSGATVTWGQTGFVPAGQYLYLGSASSSGTVVIANPLNLAGSYQYVYTNNGSANVDAELSGEISGGYGLYVSGPGVLALSGVNKASSHTVVWGNARPAMPVAISPGTLFLAYGGVLELADGFGNFTRAVGYGTNKVAWSGDGCGGFGAVGANKTVNFGGSAASITWNSAYFVTDTGALVLSSPASDAKVTFVNPLNLNGKSQRVLVNDGAAAIDGELASVLSNGGLIKEGAGTLELSATNTYTGDTTVSAGTLIARHGIAGDGSATLTGTTTIAAGACLQASHIRQNQLVIQGRVQIIADGSGTSVVNFLNIANGSGSFSWDAGGGGIEPLNFDAPQNKDAAAPVPEPATWLLVLMVALAGFIAWRRR